MNRAYSVLTVKSVDSEKRTITGTATTPTPDRMGDVVDPLGVKYKNPMPLLWQHQSSKPVGQVRFSKPTKNGIDFTAQMPEVSEPGTLKDRIDEAWQSIKLGLVTAVSIGFRPIKYAFMDDGGIEFQESEVLELSLVTIPANADALIETFKSLDADCASRLKSAWEAGSSLSQLRANDKILMFKSIDAPALAATGKEPKASDRPTPPAPGKHSKTIKAQEGKMAKKTIAEQISAFEATRQVKSAEMDGIMEASSEKGETLDAEQKQQYDDLEQEVREIDEHLVRLRAHEERAVKSATKVEDVRDGEGASKARAGLPIRVEVGRKNLLPGIGFTRFVIAQARAKGNIMQAVEIARANDQWKSETPEVEIMLRAAVSEMNTVTPGNALINYQILTAEFIEYLRPLTIIGRIPNLRRVPFNVKIGRQTGGATVNWVGQGAPKPLTSDTFDTVALDLAKIAGIIVLTDELIRLSNPAAEGLVRDDLASSIVQFMDRQFVDPTVAAVAGVSPASITNGVTPVGATGTTGAALRTDLKTLINTFLAANLQISSGVFIMTQQTAMAISLMTNSLGVLEFPQINMNGGTLLGIPVVTSENVPATGGSPTDGYPIILANASDILLADDGNIIIDASREASLQMDSAPDSPAVAGTVMVSMFQQNMTAIRAERYINWVKRRATAVQYISNARYFE